MNASFVPSNPMPFLPTSRRAVSWALCLSAALWCAGTAQAEKADRNKPMNIEADTLRYDDVKQLSIFTGNVVAIQNDTRLKSDKMIVYYTSQEDTQKSNSKQTVKKIDVEGNVFLTTPEETASGDRGNYDVEGEKIHLYDNVLLTRGTNTLKGRELVYDFASGKSVISGGNVATSGASKGKERVRALFVPEDKDTKKP